MHASLHSATRILDRRLSQWAICVAVAVVAVGATADSAVVDVESIGSRTQRLLDQADALLDDRQWDDAIETLTLITQESEGRLVPASGGRYVPLAEACQARLARLTGDALADHRGRIDPTAEYLLIQAQKDRDREPLQRIIDDHFVSSHTPEALLLLADLATEHGELGAARGVLERLHRYLTDPNGKPIGIALMGIDLEQHWRTVEDVLSAPRAALPPLYPDADGRLPDALARLVVISLEERDFDRAAVELNLLKQVAPQATGRLAGREVALCEGLAELFTEAQEWSVGPAPSSAATLGGHADRSGRTSALGDVTFPLWPKPYELAPVSQAVASTRVVRGGFVRINGRIVTRLASPKPVSQLPRAYPCVYGPWLAVRNAQSLVALNLFDGSPAIAEKGELYSSVGVTSGAKDLRLNNLQALRIIQRRIVRNSSPVSFGPLHIDEGVLYARVGPKVKPGQQASVSQLKTRIVGIGLNQEGLEVADLEQPPAPWRFSGPPVVEDGLAYVALAADEVRPRAAVACYSLANSKQLWLTSVCSGSPPGNEDRPRPPNVLTLSGDRIFLNTNMGAVGALDARSGRLFWVTEYSRQTTSGETPGVSPCVSFRGRVMVAPTDSDRTLALDYSTGRVLWSAKTAGRDVQLLGTRADVLVAAGEVLTGVDINNGQVRYQWPQSTRAGIRGIGRGCLAGEEVFWPTRDRIYALNAETGQTTRPPIDLARLGAAGANLTPAHGLLVAASRTKLMVYGPWAAEKPIEPPKISNYLGDKIRKTVAFGKQRALDTGQRTTGHGQLHAP